MTRTLLMLTALQLVGRRRAILIALAALIPIAIALLYRFAGDEQDHTPPVEFAPGLITALIITLLLPLGALVFGTAALGAEIEDGTAVYLLTKPIERWRIIAVKIAVAAGATIALAAPATLVTALIVLGGDDGDAIAVGFTIGVIVGAIAYSAVFVGLSTVTSRALIIGLAYVFVWEAFVTNVFNGTRWVSIRQYVLGVSDWISSAPPSAFEANLDGASAALAALVVVVAAFVLGVRFLERFEIGERL